tara:strand:- start:1175 stop:1453 length:279 start_codon:yes stop_codon:yes gene_type:complete
VPKTDPEPDIVDLPITFQKQLIDSIVRQMSEDKLQNLMKSKSGNLKRNKSSINDNGQTSKSQRHFVKIYKDHLNKKVAVVPPSYLTPSVMTG